MKKDINSSDHFFLSNSFSVCIAYELTNHKSLNIDHSHAGIRFGDVNHRRIKLLTLIIRISNDSRGHQQADPGQERWPHCGGQCWTRIRQFEIWNGRIFSWLQCTNVKLFHCRFSSVKLCLADVWWKSTSYN